MSDSTNKNRHVLISVDDTLASSYAVKWAAEEFCKPGDELHLTHVVLRHGTSTGWAYEANEARTKYGMLEDGPERDGIIAYMCRRFVPILENTGIPYHLDVVTNQLLQEHVAPTLVRVARNLGSPAIIMGKHHTGLQKLLRGSVTAQVMANAPVPVVVVNAPQT